MLLCRHLKVPERGLNGCHSIGESRGKESCGNNRVWGPRGKRRNNRGESGGEKGLRIRFPGEFSSGFPLHFVVLIGGSSSSSRE
jgi:hypothetical protein